MNKHMAAMEGSKDLVSFDHCGVKYTMTQQEIEAAYRYQEHQYRLQDAQCQLDILVFGCSDIDLEDPEFRDELKWFEKRHGITYAEASTSDMLERYIRRYENRFDCNQDENGQWEAAIMAVLEGKKEA